MIALIAALVFSAAPGTCSADAECVLITGCGCSCCPLPLEAVTTAEAEATRKRCATLGECGDGACKDKKLKCAAPEDPEAFKAVCQASKCVKVAKPKPQCTTDADCAMGHDCTCECCSAPWLAMPKKSAEALRRKCARLGPCGPPEGTCAGVKCPPDRDERAVCKDGTCRAVRK